MDRLSGELWDRELLRGFRWLGHVGLFQPVIEILAGRLELPAQAPKDKRGLWQFQCRVLGVNLPESFADLFRIARDLAAELGFERPFVDNVVRPICPLRL